MAPTIALGAAKDCRHPNDRSIFKTTGFNRLLHPTCYRQQAAAMTASRSLSSTAVIDYKARVPSQRIGYRYGAP